MIRKVTKPRKKENRFSAFIRLKKKKVTLSEALRKRHSSMLEKFKPTDRLSPSETAAVVSNWTSSSFADSWKETYENGEEFFGEIRDTMAPMEIWVDKKNRVVSIYYLSLSREDIAELVQIGLNSNLDADDAFISEVCRAMGESFRDEHAMEYVELDMPVTQIDLENELEDCERRAVDAYNRLESAFYNAVEGVRESRRLRRRNRRIR